MKASASQIATRYVTALFSAAPDDAAINAVDNDLQSLHAAYKEGDDLAATFKNPLLSRGELEALVTEIADKGKAHGLTKQFLLVLAQQKRLSILHEIIHQFQTELAHRRGQMRVELVTAQPLEDAVAQEIAAKIGKAYGKEITTKHRQDTALVGGIIVNIGSVQLDASISGKLQRLQQKLKAA